MNNCITKLFKIKYPIVQAGMVWNSGWKLASASSNAGILGLIGAGSMYPNTLREHIKKCKLATKNPFGVNVPLLYPNIKRIMEIIVEENVKIIFTSAGNPNEWTSWLKKNGVIVVHVVSSLKFAKKAADAGVDAIVAEGFEAGGHNGREETTTFALVPLICRQLSIPVISAGGIATGRGFLAAMALGANGVQIGSRFVASVESSAHMNFKKAVIDSKEGDTKLTLKELTPVRLLKNKFYDDLVSLYKDNPTKNDLRSFLGRARAKLGMFEGELDDGELEIGQISAIINKILPVEVIVNEIIDEYNSVINELKSINK
ncbi:MAG: NAD(P)H-dependent flavin oxidoreductase [Flavobacteriaceae bacterium]